MTEGWTPGPWQVVIDDSGDRPLQVPSIQASEELDCAIVHWDGFWQEYWQSARGGKERNANAYLMAAAPDMYTALVRARNTLQLAGFSINEANAALAKARGEHA